jgi:hypothetical protein
VRRRRCGAKSLSLLLLRGGHRLIIRSTGTRLCFPSGKYTIGIESSGMPVIVSVRNSRGSIVARVKSAIDDGKKGAVNAVLIKEKDGRLRVHSMALATLGERWFTIRNSRTSRLLRHVRLRRSR